MVLGAKIKSVSKLIEAIFYYTVGEIIVLNVVTPLFVQKLTRTLTQLFHFSKALKSTDFFFQIHSFTYFFNQVFERLKFFVLNELKFLDEEVEMPE